MMLYYSQSKGVWTDTEGLVVAGGCYAGRDAGKNNPAMQNVHSIGPLPQGIYSISPPHDIPHLGQYVMALTPDPSNNMFGRSAFFFHGDNPAHIGESSDGCIVGSRKARSAVSARIKTGDNRVTVMA